MSFGPSGAYFAEDSGCEASWIACSSLHIPLRRGFTREDEPVMAGSLTRYFGQALGKQTFRDAWKAGGWKVLIDGNLA